MLGMMSVSVSANRGLTYSAPYMTPVIDGVAEDLWLAAEWTQVDLVYDGVSESVCSARVKVMHDDQYIYFLAECTDGTIGGTDDAFEFYLDEDNCGMEGGYCEYATQLQIRLDGTVVKNGASLSAADVDSVVAYEITTSENGYVMEWAFAPLSGAPVDGAVWGLEFMYNDVDESNTFINALRWNVDTAGGDVAPWQQVADFGEMTIEAYVAPVVEEPAVEEPAADAPVEAPVTADAGIVVAAVVMAAAAAVVCKKH